MNDFFNNTFGKGTVSGSMLDGLAPQVEQLLAVVLFVYGVSLIFHNQRWAKVVDYFRDNETALFLSGMISFPISVILVRCHNVWEFSFSIIITLILWAFCAKSLLLLLYPQALKLLMEKIGDDIPRKIRVSGVVYTVLGAFYLGRIFI